MGPHSRYLGPLVPAEPQLWQDPIPNVHHALVEEQDIAALKAKILASGTIPPPARLGCLGIGVNVPRLRQARWSERRARSLGAAKGRDVNQPDQLATVLRTLEEIQKEFNSSQSGGKLVSLADLIVLGGCAAIEAAAKKAGHAVTVPFTPGRRGRVAGTNRRALVRRARADGGRVPQLSPQRTQQIG